MTKTTLTYISDLQKVLLGIAMMCMVCHFALKADDVKETLDFAHKWVRMANAIIAWLCIIGSGWEGWRTKQEVKKFVKDKLQRAEEAQN